MAILPDLASLLAPALNQGPPGMLQGSEGIQGFQQASAPNPSPISAVPNAPVAPSLIQPVPNAVGPAVTQPVPTAPLFGGAQTVPMSQPMIPNLGGNVLLQALSGAANTAPLAGMANDRITQMLQPPTGNDIADALFQVNTGPVGRERTFGDVYNELRARRIKEAQTLEGILKDRAQLQLQIEAGKRAEQQLELSRQAGQRADKSLQLQVDAGKRAQQQLALSQRAADRADKTQALNEKKFGLQQQELQFKQRQATRKEELDAAKTKNTALYNQHLQDVKNYGAEGAAKIWDYLQSHPELTVTDPTSAISASDAAVKALGIKKAVSDTNHFQSKGPYQDQAGHYIGEGIFDQRQGKYFLRGANGDMSPMPAGAVPVTESTMGKNVMSGTEFGKLAEQKYQDESSIRQLQNYFRSVKNSPSGWRLLAQQYMGELNTLLGNKITQSQFNTMYQSGQLQTLLGRFRTDVVGGGVMTEQDALRVINALGGNVSAFRNPQVVEAAIKNVLQQKVDHYNKVLLPQYNEQVKNLRRGSFSEGSSLAIDPTLFSSSDPNAPLSADEQRKLQQLRQTQGASAP